MNENKKQRHIRTIFIVATLVASVLVVSLISHAAAASRTYTTDADFDEGILVGVEHETVHDQLQLTKTATTLPFIWVPNSNEGTISKVNTSDGRELGRYRIGPTSVYPNPSRTTVDLQGNCWVGNRRTGTVVKVGLYEAGQCIDRNGNGVIDSSQDTNGDGDITGGEILPWGTDECVLYEVILIPGSEGTYIPGDYPGSYTNNDWDVSPRGLAIDASNNLWAGTWNTRKYFYISGSTGAILKTVDVSPWDHHAYGALIDGNGILWSSGQGWNHILRLDPSTDPPTIGTLNMGHFVYGLGIDASNHLFASGWTTNKLSRVNVLSGSIDWSIWPGHMGSSRGVAVTSDGDVWVANSGRNSVSRYDNNGNFKKEISVGNTPTGVAVDAVGKVWVCNNGDQYIKRIDPAGAGGTGAIDLSKRIINGYHYSYSDMTGIVARTITTKIGTWTVDFDSGTADTPWGTVSWNSEPQGSEPPGTSINVEVRSSNDQSTWSAWETATNGIALSSTPNGRYLQIQTTLQIISGDVSPVLSDLTVESAGVVELCPDEYRWSAYHTPDYEWDPFPALFRSWNDVHFVNTGTGDAYGVTATITCKPVNVVVVDGDVTLGNIPAGGSAWSQDFFELEVDMTNPQGPDKGICWRVEYDDAAGVHHAIEDIAKYCDEKCSDICP